VFLFIYIFQTSAKFQTKTPLPVTGWYENLKDKPLPKPVGMKI
jgi:hypothetical protein